MIVKEVTTIGVIPSLRFIVIVKIPVYVREGVIVNVDPDRLIKPSYVAVIVT